MPIGGRGETGPGLVNDLLSKKVVCAESDNRDCEISREQIAAGEHFRERQSFGGVAEGLAELRACQVWPKVCEIHKCARAHILRQLEVVQLCRIPLKGVVHLSKGGILHNCTT